MPTSPVGPIGPLGPLGPAAQADAPRGAAGFGAALERALGQLNELQLQADQAGQALATGQLRDVAQAVIAAEKASLALQLAIQLRNKAIQAYQQVMQMQL